MKKTNSGRHLHKAYSLLTSLPVAARHCSTCAFWGGAREISGRGFIEIHPYSKGACRGEGFKHLEMAALAACDAWEPCPALAGESCGWPK